MSTKVLPFQSPTTRFAGARSNSRTTVAQFLYSSPPSALRGSSSHLLALPKAPSRELAPLVRVVASLAVLLLPPPQTRRFRSRAVTLGRQGRGPCTLKCFAFPKVSLGLLAKLVTMRTSGDSSRAVTLGRGKNARPKTLTISCNFT